MSDDHEARLRRQVADREMAMAWAVEEIDRLRARVAELEAHPVTIEWGIDRPELGDTWRAGNEPHAREIARAYISMPVTVVSREVRTGPWVATPSVPSREETP